MKLRVFIVLLLLHMILLTAIEAVAVRKGNLKGNEGRPVEARGVCLTQGGADPDPTVQVKRDFIKLMMKDAWDDYVRYAWGQNELKPISQTGQNGGSFGDSIIGATIIDSLDTLWIMEFNEELAAGREWLESNFNFGTANTSMNIFEVTIRLVGGFVSAYYLTDDQLFADLAYDIGKQLLPAFNTPTGIPLGRINPATGEVGGWSTIPLAELGTLHLEFIALSEISGDPIFAEAALKIRYVMNDAEKPHGLYMNDVDANSGQFVGNHVSLGSGGDSFYEYLLKAYIQSGGKDTLARQMYDEAVSALIQNDMVRTSTQSHLLYIGEWDDGTVQDIGSHLECFAGGMFALGAATDPRSPGLNETERDFEIGQNFTNTCHESYSRTQTRIGPELFHFTATEEAVGISSEDRRYYLRPEVIESYFVMYRLTNDSKYRDWGWEAAQAIQKYCKVGTGRGYSMLLDVDNNLSPEYQDLQPTYFLAEVLKYLYLLFSSPDLVCLDQWVFNTEAHPLPVYQ